LLAGAGAVSANPPPRTTLSALRSVPALALSPHYSKHTETVHDASAPIIEAGTISRSLAAMVDEGDSV